MKTKKITKSTMTFNELLDKKYGRVGTKRRDKFEGESKVFILSEILKSARADADMTQEQLAEKIGTKKSYISRIENGKADIQLSTLFKIFEQGLGRRIVLEIK
ncbi:MAG TPA: helix-turn-helix transcriptional regulator [Nitrososphaera sp.]|nr:helix-turn-helix transcriptional regulator [Nitrososphaera sp.]